MIRHVEKHKNNEFTKYGSFTNDKDEITKRPIEHFYNPKTETSNFTGGYKLEKLCIPTDIKTERRSNFTIITCRVCEKQTARIKDGENPTKLGVVIREFKKHENSCSKKSGNR